MPLCFVNQVVGHHIGSVDEVPVHMDHPGLVLVADGPRLFVLIEVEAVAAEGGILDGMIQLAANPIEMRRSIFGVALIQLRVEVVPKRGDQAGANSQPFIEAAEAHLFQETFGEPRGQLKIFALRRQGFFGELNDEGIVGEFSFVLPSALV